MAEDKSDARASARDDSGDDELNEEEEAKRRRGLLETHPGLDLAAQSRKLDGGRRISALLSGPEKVWRSPEPSRIKTLLQLFSYGKWAAGGTGECVGQRSLDEEGAPGPYVWLNYDQVWNRAKAMGRAIAALPGLRSGQASTIGVSMRNCPDWLCLELAVYMSRRLFVPIFPTIDPATLAMMLKQTALEVLAMDSVERLSGLADLATAQGASKVWGPSLRHIVFCPQPSLPDAGGEKPELGPMRKKLSGLGVKLVTAEELVEQGGKAKELAESAWARPSDLALICYTSGTEGESKGVLLSHANLVASASAVGTMVGRTTRLRQEDVVFSWIPLAHIQQRCVELAALTRGARIGYIHGKMSDYRQDMKVLKPTILVTVPRLLNDLYHSVYKDESGLSRAVLKISMWWKKKRSRDAADNFYIRRRSLADKVVLKRRQEELGGALRLIVTGSAPVQGEIVKKLRLILGCVVVQGYGCTETSGAVTITNEADLSLEHQGAVVPAAVLKLRDIPEMGYSAIDDKGEVMVSGPLVAVNYLRSVNPKTGEMLVNPLTDKDGWYKTGDVGEWTDSGCLRIIDRVKNIFKLPQGVFVAPEKLESAYRMCKYMEQVFVTGDPMKPWLVAVAVPDMEMMAMCAKEDFGKEVKTEPDGGLSQADQVALCKDPAVRAVVLAELQKAGKAFGLLQYEMVRNILLRPERFSEENGLVGADQKLRRHELRRRFHKDIELLFAEIASGTAPASSAKSAKSPSQRPNEPSRTPKRKDLL